MSLASNLHRATVLLISANAISRDIDFGLIKSHTKKLCNEDRAAEVIGPVDSGDRIIAQNGASSSGKGTASISITCKMTMQSHSEYGTH